MKKTLQTYTKTDYNPKKKNKNVETIHKIQQQKQYKTTENHTTN